MEQETFKLLNKAYTLAMVLVIGILIFLVGEVMYQNRAIDQQDQNQISVSGEGKIYAKPDVALVNLGVTTRAKTVAEVAKTGNNSMNAIISAMKNIGIEEKDLQTTNYNLSPDYENTIVPMSAPSASSGSSISSYYPVPPIRTSTTVKGYVLDQNLQVKIRDFSKIGDVLAKSTDSGANVIGDLQFTIDNIQQYKDQARAKAIAQAKVNALNLAKESGLMLGKLINVSEGYSPYPVYNSMKSFSGVGMAAEAAPAPTVQPGQQEINVSINLTYKVR